MALDPYAMPKGDLLRNVGLTDHAVERFQERFPDVPADPRSARKELRRRLEVADLKVTQRPPPGSRLKQEDNDFFLWDARGPLTVPVKIDRTVARAFVAKTVVDREKDDRVVTPFAATPAGAGRASPSAETSQQRSSPSQPRVERPAPEPVSPNVDAGRVVWAAILIALLIWLGPKVLGVARDVVDAVGGWFQDAQREAYLENNHVPARLRDSCASGDDRPRRAEAALDCERGSIAISFYAFTDVEELKAHFDRRAGAARAVRAAPEGGCATPGHVVPYRSRDGTQRGRAFCVRSRRGRSRFEWYDEHSQVYAVTAANVSHARLYRWWLDPAGPAYDARGTTPAKRR